MGACFGKLRRAVKGNRVILTPPYLIELKDILLTTTLPVHPLLAADPGLSVSLIEDENIYAETPVINGDLATGVWEINSSLSANSVKQSVTLAVLANREGVVTHLVSVTLSVSELLERLKARPDGYQEFNIQDSDSSMQLVMTCTVKLLPSLIVNSSPSHVDINDDHAASSHIGNTQSDQEQGSTRREELESLYARIIRIPRSVQKAHALSMLGCLYHELYQKGGDGADLEEAISLHGEALQCTGSFRPELAEGADRLSLTLIHRFQHNGDILDIERAISYLQDALNATEDGDMNKPHRLNNLGVAFKLHFEYLGDLSDLQNAISFQQRAVDMTADGNPDKPGLLSNYGNTLESRFKRLGGLEDLEDAISNKRMAVTLTPDCHPSKPGRLNNLGIALQCRFKRLGILEDLEDAISNNRMAVTLTPDSHPDRPGWLNNLGNALRLRFERLDSPEDLEGAISNNRMAVTLTPDGHPDRPRWLNNLGNSLRLRFERLGSLEDLEDGISIKRVAVTLTPDGHPDKPILLNNLGTALQCRFEWLGSLEDLEDAISIQRVAVTLTPDGHPNMPVWLSNLGNSLQLRFERLDSLEDLEDAISIKRVVVTLTPDGHPDKPGWLNNLGTAFQLRFEKLGSLEDLEDAISTERMAVTLAPDGHPSKPGRLNNLGIALQCRFKRLGILEDLEDAISAFCSAANSLTGPAMPRFKAARSWAKLSETAGRSPLDAFRCAIDLLPRIAWLGLAVTDQHALLANIGHIVRDAVAAAIRYKDYETAVVWAEQGRSIVWQNLLGLRTPVDKLRQSHPEMADRLQRVVRQLEGSGSQDANLAEIPTASASANHSKLAIEWDDLVDKIRTLPGFEDFLRAKGFRQLAPAAHEGPVVILNSNDSHCDALVLTAEGSTERRVSVIHIPLERFSHQKAKKLFDNLTELLSLAGARERNNRKTGRALSRVDDDAKFKVILRVLWKDVVKPVIDGLAFQAQPERPPRIWWCATGLLAFLPIHAAGLYDTQEIGEKVSDFVVSSYAPTLNSILESSDPVVRDDFQVLTVAQASAPGANPIPKTEDEVEIVQELTASARALNLKREDATVQRVRAGMIESDWIHLACHGQQNHDDPMSSGFLLHDDKLKLSEIVKMSLPKADFAFLSACQMATGDEKVAEESVHLAAGMLLSGCRGVIATTWSIRDDDAPKIAREVYSRMFKDGKPNRKEAAYALHEAVKLLRESGADCVSWAPFIYIGR